MGEGRDGNRRTWKQAGLGPDQGRMEGESTRKDNWSQGASLGCARNLVQWKLPEIYECDSS